MTSQKFMDLVHYIIWKCEDPSQLGATKLNKIPWFIDTFSYQANGQSVTGERYLKQRHGPVPASMPSVLSTLVTDGKIVIKEPMFEFQPREFVALVPADTSTLSKEDLELCDSLISIICKDHTAKSISQLSHDQIWEAAQIGEEIPLFATLAATPDQITDADRIWADGILAERP